MGCTSSNAKSQETNIIDTGKSHHHHHNKDSEELINDNFRKWLKQNRPLADDYVLHDILYSQQISSGQQQQQQQQQQIQQTYESIEHDYRTIVAKALDLLSDRPDIKTVNKLTKLLTKEISTASPKKVNKTIDILRQTADKLRDGKISLDHTTINGEQINGEVITNGTGSGHDEKKIQSSHSTEPGIGLREALEKARIYFYKGKQAAIFVNPNGGYDVQVLDDRDDAINHDGNLLRSIVVTEVKMRPNTTTRSKPSSSLSQTINHGEPPPTVITRKVHDEQEISEDFRRSIDAALKGLEVIYNKTTDASHQQTTNNIVNSTSCRQIPVNIIKSDETHVQQVSTTPTISNIPITTIIKERTISPVQYGMTNVIDHHKGQSKITTNIDEIRPLSTKQTSPPPHSIDIQSKLVDNVNELTMDSIESTTKCEIAHTNLPLSQEKSTANIERITAELKQHGEKMKLIADQQQQQQIQEEHRQPNIERIVQELKEHGEKMLTSEHVLDSSNNKPLSSSSYSIGITSEPIHTTTTTTPIKREHVKLRHENRPKSFITEDTKPSTNENTNRYSLNKQISESYLDDLTHLTQIGMSNPTLHNSKLSSSSTKIIEEEKPQIQQTVEQTSSHQKPIKEEEPKELKHVIVKQSSKSESVPTVSPIRGGHNVTYTEIIHSESNNGEHSSRTITESYDENRQLLNNDGRNGGEQTTTLKVVTKSEFSNHPTEKIMEQSVQVITVKVRNETIKTTVNPTATTTTTSTIADENYERRPVSELVKNFEQET